MEHEIRQLQQYLIPYGGLTTKEWSTLSTEIRIFAYRSAELLTASPGDIYFICAGIVLKYRDNDILRIIKPNTLLFVPLERSTVRFSALTDCRLLLIERDSLYRMIAHYPHLVQLYDRVLEDWNSQVDDRLELLREDKIQRIALFKARHRDVLLYMLRRDIASYLCVSEEHLRKKW